MTGTLILCADDFGASDPVNEAIVALAAAGRLSAATIMTGEPGFREGLPALRGHPAVELGLHVTLSGARATRADPDLAPAGRLPSVDALTRKAFAGSLPLRAIAAEMERQFDRFEEEARGPPDFVDSHQHSHLLPGIRALFLDVVKRRAPQAWVRDCHDRLASIVARGGYRWLALRSSLLSSNFRRDAAAAGLASNDSFAGIYALRAGASYAALFPGFLKQPGRNHLVICHPANAIDPQDRIAPARLREFEYLSTAPLEALAQANGLAIGRFGASTGGSGEPA